MFSKNRPKKFVLYFWIHFSMVHEGSWRMCKIKKCRQIPKLRVAVVNDSINNWKLICGVFWNLFGQEWIYSIEKVFLKKEQGEHIHLIELKNVKTMIFSRNWVSTSFSIQWFTAIRMKNRTWKWQRSRNFNFPFAAFILLTFEKFKVDKGKPFL